MKASLRLPCSFALAAAAALVLAPLAAHADEAFVPGFLPSQNGLHFPNSFPHIPVWDLYIAGIDVPIGDAANGLCGGMAYTVRDYFENGCAPPAATTPPDGGDLYEYITGRLLDSFDLPIGPARYLELMDPLLPDGETWLSWLHLAPHGRAYVTANEEWPKVKADLDSGVLSPLGLIQVKSADPFDMGENHQVLAYGYDLEGTQLTIYIYDPNHPDDDNVTLSLDIGDTWDPMPIVSSTGDMPIYAFFRSTYYSAAPPSCGAE